MSTFNAGGISTELILDVSKYTAGKNTAIADTRELSKVVETGLGGAAKTASGDLASMGHAAAAAGAEASKAKGGFEGLASTVQSVANVAGMVNPRIGQLASGFNVASDAAAGMTGPLLALLPALGAVAAGGLAARAAFDFASTGVKLAAEMEQTSLAFEVMIGNAGKAQATLESLKTFANTTPFEFPEIANAAKQLLAMGIDAKDLTSTLRMLGDVGSGLHQPLGEMAYLFGQIRSQGRAMTQDLNQFAGRGVPIYSELAKVLHTNELGVRSLAETGKIGFAEINAAFESMTSAGGKFFGMTSRQAGTLSGELSTLADSWGEIQRQVGAAVTKNLDLKGAVESMTSTVAAVGPAAVDAFGSAAKWMKEVWDNTAGARGTLADLITLTREYKAMAGEADVATHGWAAAILDISSPLTGLKWILSGLKEYFKGIFLWVKPLADVVHNMAEELRAIHLLGSDESVAERIRNQNPLTKAELDAAAAAKAAKHPNATAPSLAAHVAAAATPVASPASSPHDEGSPRARTGGSERPSPATAAAPTAPAGPSLASNVWVNWDEAIKSMRLHGQAERADLWDARIKSQREHDKTSDPAELARIEQKYAEDYAAIRKRYADQRAQAAKTEETDRKASAERIAEFDATAHINAMRVANRTVDAERLELEERWRKRLADLKPGAERDAAIHALQSERAILAQHQAEDAKRESERNAKASPATTTDLSSHVRASIDQLTGRVADAAHDRDSGRRAMAQLDLREALGHTLDRYQRAQSGRLHDRFDFDALNLPDVSGPARRMMARLRNVTSGAGDRDGSGSTTSGGSASAIANGATVNISGPDAAQIAKALTPMVEGKFNARIAQLERFAEAVKLSGYAARGRRGV